jgi:transmembrane sensor
VSQAKPTSSDLRISEEAALWLIEFDAGTADHVAFAAWLEASPRHVEEFLLASALWHASEGLDPARAIDVDRLVQEASRNVHPLDDTGRAAFSLSRPRSAQRRWIQVAAALVTIAAGVALWAGYALRAPQYVTGVGEQRVLKLPDGSIVTLNTRSRVTVRYNDNERRVELADGEAHFDVQPDAERPFRVISGGAAVQAIGTQFNVRRAP